MTSQPIRLAIIGDGKMGQAVAGIARTAGHTVTAMIGHGSPITRDTLGDAHVAVEFTQPDAAVQNIRACVDAHCPVVVGTTGWYDALPDVDAYVRQHDGAMLWAANFSLGVHLFAKLLEYAGTLMSRVPAFDVHLVETHHTEKKDAPSGTALMLRDAIAPGLGHDVPVTSIRVGRVPGTHELICDAQYEQITLAHTARDRRVFAEGAVAAAQWLNGRTGVYTIADMLGTNDA